MDDGALRVLVRDPVDMAMLEDLADSLDLPVQPLIVPEYRWYAVFARTYDQDTPARYATLAKQAETAAAVAPVGRTRTVIVSPEVADAEPDAEVVDVIEGAGGVPLRPVSPDDPTMKYVSPSAGGARQAAPYPPVPDEQPGPDDTPREVPQRDPGAEGDGATRRATTNSDGVPRETEPGSDAMRTGAPRVRRTLHGMPPVRAAAAGRAPAEEPAVPGHAGPDEPTAPARIPTAEPHPVEAAETAPTAPTTSPTEGLAGIPGLHPVPRATTQPAEVAPPEPGDAPIAVVTARAALATADDRDAIFTLLLRALRSRARWAGLLTVQGGAAIGRLAIAEPGIDATGIARLLIPLDTPSAFASILQTRLHHVGPIATGDADIDGMLARMGGVVPASALLLPIALKDRIVAIAVAHRLERPLGIAQVAELLPLAQVVGDALGRLIVKQKSIGYRAPTAEPIPLIEIDGGEIPTKRIERRASEWSVPADAPAPPELDHALEEGTELSMTAEPPRPIGEVLDEVEGPEGETTEHAIAEAVERATEVLPQLSRRFPGALRVDRYQVSGRALRAAQYGGLLDLVVRLGSPVSDLLVEKMADTHHDVRFYATVCAAELRPRSAVYALVERLFDSDYGVRTCAVEALAGYPVRDLDLAMVRCRHAIHSDDPERVAAAATAVAELADVLAIPDLLDTIGRDGKRAEHARRALSVLTRQDFGTSARKWRRWWDDNRARHRVEWLIDALGHKDAALRQAAAEDLRKLTGEYFGYHHDMARKERSASLKRWRQWWNDAGRRRFVRDDDERHRPTAVLPQIKH